MPSAQAAINGQVSIVGSESQYWNTYQVTLTNQGNQAIDFVELKFSLIRIYPYLAHHGLQIQSAIQP
ncbi:hypothetical protein Q8W15_12065 [Photobacterium damselae subsp. piscicida]|nr:hypothetical protein [Photobacterium damselae subsp. piscicida]